MDSIGDMFGKIIAINDGVSPDEVTSQYIHEQREKMIYPNLTYDDDELLRSYSRTQWEKIEIICDEALASL